MLTKKRKKELKNSYKNQNNYSYEYSDDDTYEYSTNSSYDEKSTIITFLKIIDWSIGVL